MGRTELSYKIAPGKRITFGWLITSVLNFLTSLTISAVCDNGNTCAIGPTDGVGPGTAMQVMPMIQDSSCAGDSLAFSTEKKSSGRNGCNFN